MKHYVAITLHFLLALSIQRTTSWRSYTIQLTEMKCKHNPAMMKYLNCSLSVVPPQNLSAFSLEFEQNEEITEAEMKIKVTIVRSGAATPMNLLNLKLDLCNFLASGLKTPATKMLFEQIRHPNITNTPEQCPLKKDTLYYIRNVVFDPEQFPPYTPPVEFKANVLLKSTKNWYMDILVTGATHQKGRDG